MVPSGSPLWYLKDRIHKTRIFTETYIHMNIGLYLEKPVGLIASYNRYDLFEIDK